MIGPKTAKWVGRAAESTGREIVMLRDAGVCVRCGRVDPVFGVNHDHRLNRSQGGDWAPSNGQLMCGSGTVGCHGWATTHPKDAMEQGWAVPSWGEPARWPARRWFPTDIGTRRLGWALLDDTGNVTEIPESEALELMKGAGW